MGSAKQVKDVPHSAGDILNLKLLSEDCQTYERSRFSHVGFITHAGIIAIRRCDGSLRRRRLGSAELCGQQPRHSG
jgi:hypothetical protein